MSNNDIIQLKSEKWPSFKSMHTVFKYLIHDLYSWKTFCDKILLLIILFLKLYKIKAEVPLLQFLVDHKSLMNKS